MIINIVLYIIGALITLLARILPAWQPWPQQLIDGLSWICSKFMLFNFIFPVVDWVAALFWFLSALSIYLFARLSVMIINFFRGVGKIEV
jgi:hypothetical protein